MKKRLPYLIALALSFLTVLGIYLVYRLKTTIPPESLSTYDQIVSVENKPENPISKYITPETDTQGRGIVYEVFGSFAGNIIIDGARTDKAALANFVVKDDSLKRKLPVVLGISTGKVNFGVFEGSFDADSTWKPIEVGKFIDQLKEGETVKIVVDYSLPAGLETIPDYVLAGQSLFDNLIKEFNNNSFSMEIPENMTPLVIGGVGVVR